MKVRIRRVVLLGAFLVPGAGHAQGLPKVDLSTDLRLRLEEDWDSHTATGTERPDRARTRIRARVMAAADLGDGFRLQARLRTAVPDSQQNANVTFADFDHNPTDIFRITPDRFALAWQGKAVGAEIGRMGFPFFTTNEYFWDADISPLGGAATISIPLAGKTRVKLIGGGFVLPVGLSHYATRLFAGQVVAEHGPATLAAGLFRFKADRDNPARLLQLDDNGSRDYTVLAVDTQVHVQAGRKPLAFTADLYRNVQGYATDADPISRANDKQRTGFVLGAAWGDVAAKRHLQLGYRYFRMERLAVDSSYSHDDVARLGTPQQAALSDLRGHDLYTNYALTRHWTLGMRTMFTHRITNREDDKRARLDATYAF